MGLFSKKKPTTDTLIELTQFEIEIIVLEKIPQLDVEHITVSTYDQSVTQLRIPPLQSKEEKDGVERNVQHPEIIFNLKVMTKTGEQHLENISLVKALLPSFHLIASKCVSIEDESVIGEMNGTKFYKKLVYDLVCLTRDTLIKTNLDYEEYRKELEALRKKHVAEIEELKEDYKKWKTTMEEPYKDREKQIKNALEKSQTEVMNLLFVLPQQRNAVLKEAIKKLNPMNIDF